MHASLTFLPILASCAMLVLMIPGSLAFSEGFSLFSWKSMSVRQLRSSPNRSPRMLLQKVNDALQGGLQAISTTLPVRRPVTNACPRSAPQNSHSCKRVSEFPCKKKICDLVTGKGKAATL
jgi:hypothetical protein